MRCRGVGVCVRIYFDLEHWVQSLPQRNSAAPCKFLNSAGGKSEANGAEAEEGEKEY